MGVSVSTDDALLDVDRIHRWLSEDAYWALGRSRETVEVSLRHSVNVGAYDDGPTVPCRSASCASSPTARPSPGCATCTSTRPRAAVGVGKLLMAEADRLMGEYGVRRAMLATADAHGLYEQYGFTPLGRSRPLDGTRVRSNPHPPGSLAGYTPVGMVVPTLCWPGCRVGSGVIEPTPGAQHGSHRWLRSRRASARRDRAARRASGTSGAPTPIRPGRATCWAGGRSRGHRPLWPGSCRPSWVSARGGPPWPSGR